jgi:hypothetical protein
MNTNFTSGVLRTDTHTSPRNPNLLSDRISNLIIQKLGRATDVSRSPSDTPYRPLIQRNSSERAVRREISIGIKQK